MSISVEKVSCNLCVPTRALCHCAEENAINSAISDLIEKINDMAVVDGKGRKTVDRNDVIVILMEGFID